jgi:hypothetical protein
MICCSYKLFQLPLRDARLENILSVRVRNPHILRTVYVRNKIVTSFFWWLSSSQNI